MMFTILESTFTSTPQLIVYPLHFHWYPSISEIAEVAASVGFRVRLLAFEKLTAMHQVQASASVDVLAGMHGENLGG